ncbi:MAG: mycofactocin precursor peptide peptidase [Mycobacterium sp.]|nr:mycofactocin biosynthesis peptidyl-dipeptidase MftE [Mycobacterium sp.]MDT5134693.1 mycofactocin precursor peptide peptidase [Mycobacterium sp.]
MPTFGAYQVNSAYHRHVVFPTELGKSTSKQIYGTSPTVVIPVGSTEQHGPHLPLDTDTRIASAVANAAVSNLRAAGYADNVLVAPPVAYGASGEHEAFAGTVSIGTRALEHLLLEYGRSAANWARRLVFVNGHGGNVDALRDAVSRLRLEERDVGWCSCTASDGDAHAGHTETSVLLHISPESVSTGERHAGNVAPLAELMPQMRRGGMAAVSEVGVLGDPTTATAAEGARIFADMVEGCAARIKRWTPGGNGMLR